MAETTNIEWADSTLNIWEGCQETGSPACVGCYARARNLRYAPKGTTEAPNWGPHAPRREVKGWPAMLRKISRLAAAAFAAGRTQPWFVFVNSLSDFWDNQADPALRARALAQFAKHPHLTFLLLTKRPQNIVKMVKAMAEADLGPYADEQGIRSWWPKNVAIGFTAVTQREMHRDGHWALEAFHVLNAPFLFWSGEPLVERVVIPNRLLDLGPRFWAITGGETDQSGHKARPQHPDWFRGARDQCASSGSPYLHKQNGEWAEPVAAGMMGNEPGLMRAQYLYANKGQYMVHVFYDHVQVARVGKKQSGRLLDGVTHDARPEVRA